MDADLSLATGATLLCFSIPSLVAAGVDRRFPWAGLVVLCVGLGLILWVAIAMHGPEADFLSGTMPRVLAAIPHAFLEIAGRVVAYFF